MRVVNLARRPFTNDRPVRRAALLSWIAAALLLIVNVVLYAGYWTSSADIRAELAEIDGAIAAEAAAFDGLAGQLESLDLGEQNEAVRALNQLIDYRTFPWSGLFEDLEAVLPDDVRLVHVSPAIDVDLDSLARRSRGRSRSAPRGMSAEARRTRDEDRRRPLIDDSRNEEVPLSLVGYTRREEALYELLDTLYANPSFREPVLDQEARDERTTEIAFNLEVHYRTGAGDDEPVLVEGVAPLAAGTGQPGDGDGDGIGDAGERSAATTPAGTATGARTARDPRRPVPEGDVPEPRSRVATADPAGPSVTRSSPAAAAPPPTGRVASGRPPTAGSLPAGTVVGQPATTPTPRSRAATPPPNAPATNDDASRYRPRTTPATGRDDDGRDDDGRDDAGRDDGDPSRQPTTTRPEASPSARLGGGGAP